MRITDLREKTEKKIDITPLKRVLTPNFHKLVETISQYGYEVRIVGGAVRDLLLGRPPRDIDLATDAMPDELMFILNNAGIAFTAKGIAHGTLKAMFGDDEEYEITALSYQIDMRDGKLFIKHSNDWESDAKRRDFTINSMSLGLDGTLYDYLDGEDDLRNQRVRMVGNPQERLEDHPELALRFFKALSFFKHPKFDRKMLEVIRDHRHSLKSLGDQWVRYQLININKGPSGDAVKNLMCQMGLGPYFDMACSA